MKFERKQFCQIVSYLWVKLSWKTSLLVISEVLGVFVDIFTADDKYSFSKRENILQDIRMQLSEKSSILINFILHCWNLNQTFNNLKKKMSLRAQVIPKLFTRKNVLAYLSEKQRFRTPSSKQRVKLSQTVLKSAGSNFMRLLHQPVKYWNRKQPCW